MKYCAVILAAGDGSRLKSSIPKPLVKIDNKSIRHMKRRLIIDCRRIFAEEKIDAEYYALGIGQ